MPKQNTFAQKIKRAQEIIAMFENSDLSLEQAIVYHKECSELLQQCEKSLQEAKFSLQKNGQEKEESTTKYDKLP